MISLVLLFDSEADRRRFVADQLGADGPVVSLSWVQACPVARWHVWRAENVRDHALTAVITHDAATLVRQSVRPPSPVIYSRALLGFLPPELARELELLQMSYAAHYARHARAARAGYPQQMDMGVLDG